MSRSSLTLEVREADVSYGRKRVVQGATLTVEGGRIVALVGHNGAGKTTLLRAIMGLLPLERGEVLFDGQSIPGRSTAEIIRRGVADCPQGGQGSRPLPVDEDLELAPYHLRDSGQEAANRESALALFPILRERQYAQAGTLSGGERQQLAIAMALMTSPRVLLLDEPSGGLAPLLVERVFQSIRQINQERGTALLVVEQNLRQAFGIAEQVYVLRSGSIVYSGDPDKLEHDESLRQAILGF